MASEGFSSLFVAMLLSRRSDDVVPTAVRTSAEHSDVVQLPFFVCKRPTLSNPHSFSHTTQQCRILNLNIINSAAGKHLRHTPNSLPLNLLVSGYAGGPMILHRKRVVFSFPRTKYRCLYYGWRFAKRAFPYHQFYTKIRG